MKVFAIHSGTIKEGRGGLGKIFSSLEKARTAVLTEVKYTNGRRIKNDMMAKVYKEVDDNYWVSGNQYISIIETEVE